MANLYTTVSLQVLINIKHGFAFESEFFTNEPTDYILLTPGNFHRNQYLYFGENTKFYKGAVPTDYILHNGDLVVVMTDLTKEMNILGNSVIVKHEKKVLHNQRIGKVEIVKPDLIDKIYLSYMLNSDLVRNHIKTTASGSTVRHTSPQRILDASIPLPPLPEQRKIAEILSTWDEAIDLTEQLIAAKQRRKQALMQRLLTGQVRFPGFEDEWEERRLDEISKVTGGKRLPKGHNLVDTYTGHPYIRVSDMGDSGIITDAIQYVPKEVASQIKAYRIFDGDIYFSVAGTIGLVGMVPPELDGANLTENADRISSIKCNPLYLLNVLRSSIIKSQVEQVVTTNAQPKLALERLRGFIIPLPSSEEQQRIADILMTCNQELALHQQKLAALRRQKQGLMQQLLTGRVRVAGSGGA